ncbi:MAG: DUF3352 domain-containing protein [Bacteroidia bacterium]|nr:DUF3352 domain-containing protein [Bacteroidia bacterium]
MKRILRTLFFLLLLLIAAVVGYFYFGTAADTRSPWEFVASDFIYAIESDKPIKDWRDLSKTEVWQYLKTNEFFSDVEKDADYADSLLIANERILKFVNIGGLVISAHLTPQGKEDYDFVILVDMEGNARLVNKFKDWAMPLMKNVGYEVKRETYFTIEIYDLYDPKEDLSMYLAAVDNMLIISYSKSLVQKAIKQSEEPDIREDPAFKQVKAKTNPGELYNLFINYGTVNDMMAAYTASMPETVQGLDKTLTFSGMDLTLKDDKLILKGYTLQNDSFPNYLRVFKDVGQGKIRAANVLPRNTAMYTSIGFDDFSDFYTRLMGYNKQSDPEGYASLQKSLDRTQKLLKIDFERDFFEWMNEEMVSAIIPADEKASSYDFFAMLHFDDEKVAKERMDFVVEKIRKRTPLKFKSVDYRGFEIKYLELNSFFKLFFKKMFSEIEKPHYTYIDNYVVFSNDTTSLINMIEMYLDGQTLSNQEDYQEFMGNFSSSSNVFNYVQMRYFYPYLYSTMDAESRRGLRKNRQYIFSFPHVGLQLYPKGGMYKMDLYGAFEKPGS